MTTQEELSVRLKQLGIRLTPQRLAIAEVVVNSGDHPSVKEIYERVKAFFPYVTLATVYSTLDVLERAAIVRELPFIEVGVKYIWLQDGVIDQESKAKAEAAGIPVVMDD